MDMEAEYCESLFVYVEIACLVPRQLLVRRFSMVSTGGSPHIQCRRITAVYDNARVHSVRVQE